MSATEDLVVTIEVDTSRFHEAMRKAILAAARYARQRQRSRLVTRRKQRRHW